MSVDVLESREVREAAEEILKKKVLRAPPSAYVREGEKCLYPSCSKEAYSKYLNLALCKEHWDLTQYIAFIISKYSG